MSWSNIHRYCLSFSDSSKQNYAYIHHLLLCTEEDLYTPNGISPLHLSANGSSSRLLNYFLLQESCDIDVNARTFSDETTPLHWACRNGTARSVQLLLRHGADIHAVDWEKNTPLHYAVEGLNYDVVRSLLERDDIARSVAICNLSGLSPYDVAVEDGDKNMLALFAHLLPHSICPLPPLPTTPVAQSA